MVEHRQIPTEAPFAEHVVAVVDGSIVEARLRLAQGTRLEEVVDLTLFEGFEPGMSLADAVARHGDGYSSSEVHGVPFHAYRRPGGRVGTSHVPQSDGHAAWIVSAILDPERGANPILDRRLSEELRAHLAGGGDLSAVIARSSGYPGVSVQFRGERVTEMTLWGRDETGGRRPQSNPEACR